MAVLFLFLVTVDVLIVSREREAKLDNVREHAERELSLVGTFVTEPMLMHEFAVVEQFILQWGEKDTDVISFKASTPEGTALADFRRPTDTRHSLTLRKQVTFVGKHLLDLEVVRDLSGVERALSSLYWQFVLRSIVLTFILGTVVWYIFWRMGLIPLEKEIDRRREAEDALRTAKDGLEVTVQERTKELTSTNNALLAEITERTTAEEELKKSEHRYRNLFENSPISLWLEDFSIVKMYLEKLKDSGIQDMVTHLDDHADAVAKGVKLVNVLDVNKTTVNMFQAINKEEFLRCLDLVYAEETYDVLKKQLVAVAEGRTMLESEAIMKTITGAKKQVFLRWSVSPGHEDTMERVIVSIVDITERKMLEDELQRSQKHESIGILAGGIAHDFNNLLTGILGNINLVKTRMDPTDDVYPRLEESEAASLKARDLTRQLLMFSSGGTPTMRSVSIATVLEDAANFGLSGTTVTSDIGVADDIWHAEVDRGQVSQAIYNIIINASEAMPEGGAVKLAAENVTINAEHGLPLRNGDYVKITIADEGSGIPEEHLQKIFDPYFTTKESVSGLGLSVAYSIVKAHKGYLSVESNVGVGTTCTLFLPAAQQASPER